MTTLSAIEATSSMRTDLRIHNALRNSGACRWCNLGCFNLSIFV